MLRRRRSSDPTQLALRFETQPRDADELLEVLRALGLRTIRRCRLTRNRNVMVSFGKGTLRVHQGYLSAPPAVLKAIVTFVEGRTRAERRAAQQVIVGHPIRVARPPARRERTNPEDEPIAQELAVWHRRYNTRYFDGELSTVPIRVSRRMRSRLGHYSAAAAGGEPAEIAISLAHLRRHGWEETLHTLLHEMVHQWQDEDGHTIDHGRTFRLKARELRIAPMARRTLPARPRRTEWKTLGRKAAREG